jgi:hypothetical protein
LPSALDDTRTTRTMFVFPISFRSKGCGAWVNSGGVNPTGNSAGVEYASCVPPRMVERRTVLPVIILGGSLGRSDGRKWKENFGWLSWRRA